MGPKMSLAMTASLDICFGKLYGIYLDTHTYVMFPYIAV